MIHIFLLLISETCFKPKAYTIFFLQSSVSTPVTMITCQSYRRFYRQSYRKSCKVLCRRSYRKLGRSFDKKYKLPYIWLFTTTNKYSSGNILCPPEHQSLWRHTYTIDTSLFFGPRCHYVILRYEYNAKSF